MLSLHRGFFAVFSFSCEFKARQDKSLACRFVLPFFFIARSLALRLRVLIFLSLLPFNVSLAESVQVG